MNKIQSLKPITFYFLFIGIPVLLALTPNITTINNSRIDLFMSVILPLNYFLIFFIFWLISSACTVQKNCHERLKMNFNSFIIAITLVIFFTAINLTYFTITTFELVSIENEKILRNWFQQLHELIIIYHSSFIYSVYFISKTLKIIKLQSDVSFQKCLPYMLAIGALPLTAWFINPIIVNQGIKETANNA
jgi:hypothetical protein